VGVGVFLCDRTATEWLEPVVPEKRSISKQTVSPHLGFLDVSMVEKSAWKNTCQLATYMYNRSSGFEGVFCSQVSGFRETFFASPIEWKLTQCLVCSTRR
jgi:hypothetical protein